MTAPKPPQSHYPGHDTEHQAAASMIEHQSRMQRAVMAVFVSRFPEGVTDDEGAAVLRQHFGFPSADRLTFGRRRQELVEQGQIVDSGQRRTAPSGRSAIVWRYRSGPAQ